MQQHAQLSDAAFGAVCRDVPDVYLVIDPLAIAVLVAQLTDGPFASRELVERVIWASN